MRKVEDETRGNFPMGARLDEQPAGSAARSAWLLVILAAWAAPASAEHTRFWRQSDFEDFDSGTAHGVALRSDGKIVLAPKFAPFADPNLAYLWALRLDSKGNLYAAGGTNAKVLRIDPAGKMTTAFESEELTAQALTLDKNDNLYVATSPDGKVYKVTPNGQKSVFFDPKAKYIWDLALGADGTLYVATGDAGKIFAVTADGKGGEFYTSTETHIRAILLDGKGNLLAGTEPNGLVLRIPLAAPPAAATEKRAAAKPDAAKQTSAQASADDAKANSRDAYVIYETAKKEITALLPDSAGNLYVGAIGDKTRGGTPAFPQNGAAAAQQPQARPTCKTDRTSRSPSRRARTPQQPTAFLPFPSLTSSSVYRIAADGSPEEIWTSRDDSVYALGLSADGKLLLGVGNEGSVIELGPDRVFSRLAKTASEQVTGFARASNGKIYVATSNPANVSSLGPDLESEGTFESQAFDAHLFSRWGHLTWWGQNAASQNPNVEFYVRAGNTSDPADSWSPWFGPYRDPKGEQTQSPCGSLCAVEGGSARLEDSGAGDLLGEPGLPAEKRRPVHRRNRHPGSGRPLIQFWTGADAIRSSAGAHAADGVAAGRCLAAARRRDPALRGAPSRSVSEGLPVRDLERRRPQ